MVESILSTEMTSVTTAVQMLLDRMCYLKEVGWFQAFLDILLASSEISTFCFSCRAHECLELSMCVCWCAVEYTGLHRTIKEWSFHELDELSEHRRFPERIEPSITKHERLSEAQRVWGDPGGESPLKHTPDSWCMHVLYICLCPHESVLCVCVTGGESARSYSCQWEACDESPALR